MKKSISVARTNFPPSLMSAACVAGALLLAGCDRSTEAKPYDTVTHNVAATDQATESKVATVQEQPDSNDYTVTLARAAGAHDAAVQKCEAMSGQDQTTCKHKADADYDAAKANAKPTKPMQPVAPVGNP